MIDPRLVPTPLVNPSARRVSIASHARGRRLATFAWVARWTLSLVRARLRGTLTGDEAGARVRVLAEHLGGLWVKLAQLVSLRIDLFGTGFCRELARLQDLGTGFPGETAVAIVERELGRPIDAVFEWFDAAPIAAASIGQVHRARLRQDGEIVAVKVQRPGIADRIARQLMVLERLAAIAVRLRVLPQLAWRTFAWELREVMREEVDYRFEAANTRRMRRTLRRHGILSPRVYGAYSTASVLTTEFIDGVAIADYINTALADPERASTWLAENRIDRRRVARRLSLSLLRQILEDNLFHGDLHPGNIMLLRDSRIALIDFGTVSSTERQYLEQFRLVAHALTTRNFAKAAEVCLLMCGRLPPIDLAPVVGDLVGVVQAWTARTSVRELPFHQKSLNNVYSEVTRTLIRHGCVLEWAFLRIRRAQETLDASLLVLYPEANPTEVTEAYFEQSSRRTAGRVGAFVVRDLARAAARAEQTANDLAMTTIFQFELIRRRAHVFATHSGRLVSATAMVTGAAGVAGLGACVALAFPGAVPDALAVSGVAGLDVQLRMLAVGVAGAFALSCLRLRTRIRRADVRLVDAAVRV